MLGVSGIISSESAGTRENRESGAVSGGSSEVAINFTEEDKRNMEELGERNSGGNRWPRQETIALLKIRSEMDVVFRDSSLKGPLWEEVSRKMAELGYYRNAKKCKEKFENVYKYHKRTKDGRASKSDGKNYRFFEQLEALENYPPHHSLMLAAAPSTSTSRHPPPPLEATPINMAMPMPPSANTAHQDAPIMNNIPASSVPVPPQVISGNVSMSYSTSSSTSSDEDIQRRHKKKRKWKDFFERLMKDVIEKQEELQRNFLESLEKREGERIAREEAWRVEQVTRMNREHDVLVKERSMAAAKDAAVISFLQKITEQQNINISAPQQQQPVVIVPPHLSLPLTIQPPIVTVPPQTQTTQVSLPLTIQPPIVTVPPQTQVLPLAAKKTETRKSDHNGDTQASSSRWPKTEVEALIRLRTNLDVKYLENGPKGPLWEEISAGMKKLGYNRNSKRCKEKWENINKYFKKVKESNKRRPQDSKTCPYFHQLDELYREKANTTQTPLLSTSTAYALNNPMPSIMPRPLHPIDETELSDDDEDEENAYQILTNKQQSSTTL